MGLSLDSASSRPCVLGLFSHVNSRVPWVSWRPRISKASLGLVVSVSYTLYQRSRPLGVIGGLLDEDCQPVVCDIQGSSFYR